MYDDTGFHIFFGDDHPGQKDGKIRSLLEQECEFPERQDLGKSYYQFPDKETNKLFTFFQNCLEPNSNHYQNFPKYKDPDQIPLSEETLKRVGILYLCIHDKKDLMVSRDINRKNNTGSEDKLNFRLEQLPDWIRVDNYHHRHCRCSEFPPVTSQERAEKLTETRWFDAKQLLRTSVLRRDGRS